MPHLLFTVLTFTVPFMVVLGFIVTIHEFGHFIIARACGVAIERFSIGFGRAILKRTDGAGVEWRIGWIPLGGYVKFAGDVNAASVPDQAELETLKAELQRSGPQAVRSCFYFKPVWQRALIAAAGPLANFVLAIAAFTVIFLAYGDTTSPAKITQVEAGSPAAAAGFEPGDLVLKIDGRRIAGFEDLQRDIQLRAGVPMSFLVDRGGQDLTLTATPVSKLDDDPIMGRQHIGHLGLGGTGQLVTLHYDLPGAIRHSFERCWDVLSTTGYYLKRVFTGQASADQIGGVIGIAHTTGKVAQQAVEGAQGPGEIAASVLYSFLSLSGFISLSVGLANLLPIPILDGGHLVFYAYEALARRPVPGRVQDVSYRVGLALLVGFMLFAAWNDLQRLNMFHLFSGSVS